MPSIVARLFELWAPGPRGPASSGAYLTGPMDRQVVRRDDVALLRESAQVELSSSSQEQVDHSTASLADEMIVLAGLRIESGSLVVQEEGANLTLLNESVKVAINGSETDPRQPFVNPPIDLVGERMRVIALEGFEHLLELTCCTFTNRSPHRLPRFQGYRTERNASWLRSTKSWGRCQPLLSNR